MATELRLQVFKAYFETTQSGKPLLEALRGEPSLYKDALIAYYANTTVVIKLHVDRFIGRPLPSIGAMGLFRKLRILHAVFFIEKPNVGNLHSLALLGAMPNVQSLEYEHHDLNNSPIPALAAMVTAFSKLAKLKLVISKSDKAKIFLEQLLLHLEEHYMETLRGGSRLPLMVCLVIWPD